MKGCVMISLRYLIDRSVIDISSCGLLAALALMIILFVSCARTGPQKTAADMPLPRHGIMFDTPVMVWDEALPLGNGNLGALVWGDGMPLKISLDRKDLWDTRPVPEFTSNEYADEYSYEVMCRWHREGRHEDLKRMYEAPYHRPAPTKIPAGRIEIGMGDGIDFASTGLSLVDATAIMNFANDAKAEVFVNAHEAVGMVRIQGAPENIMPKLKAPPFSGDTTGNLRGSEDNTSDLSLLGYPAPDESAGDGWQAFTQQGTEGFHFAVYLGWRMNGGVWTAAWSIATNNEGPDPLSIARNRVAQALDRGYDDSHVQHAEWWRNYWAQSSLRLPNPVIERQWYLEQYKFGAASRRGFSPITLQGVWTADNDRIPPWKGDYHHDLNTQLSYWPCYSGNHMEEGLSYLDWLWDTRDNCFEWTQRFFKLPGLCVPMTADINNRQIGGWRQYTHSPTTAAWLAHHFYLHWKYSADDDFLRERCYPYLRDCAVFLEAVSEERDENGKRSLPLSASPEINDNRPEAWFPTLTNYDLALMRWLFAATAECAEKTGDTDDAAHWRTVLSELPDLSLGSDGKLLVAKDYPLEESHRHFSHLMAIHPLGLIDMADGDSAARIIQASMDDLERIGTKKWCGYSFAWLSNLAARAGDGAKAEHALELFSTAFTLRNSFHCNGDQSGQGYSDFVYRPFTLEGNFAAAAGIQEMLLQSHRGVIMIFPSIPDDWQDVSFTSLRAEGAFLVTAKRRGGKTVRLEIEAEHGGNLHLLSPFSGKIIERNFDPGEIIVLTGEPDWRS